MEEMDWTSGLSFEPEVILCLMPENSFSCFLFFWFHNNHKIQNTKIKQIAKIIYQNNFWISFSFDFTDLVHRIVDE